MPCYALSQRCLLVSHTLLTSHVLTPQHLIALLFTPLPSPVPSTRLRALCSHHSLRSVRFTSLHDSGMYIAIVSTTVETSNPIAELNPGIALLKDIVERFDSVNDLLAPVADGTGDKCYISKSYDATRCVRGGGGWGVYWCRAYFVLSSRSITCSSMKSKDKKTSSDF